MSKIRESVIIKAPAERVWTVVQEDVVHAPRWTTNLEKVEKLDAGAPRVGTRYRYHLDLPGGITHSFHDGRELVEVFRSIAADRQQRIDSVKDLTWTEYARKHAIVWRALLDGRSLADVTPAGAAPIAPAAVSAARRRVRGRLFKSEFWPFYFESRKFLLRGRLSRLKRWLLMRRSS